MVLFFLMKIHILAIKNAPECILEVLNFKKFRGKFPWTPLDAYGLRPLVIMTVGALVTNFTRSTLVYKYLYFKYLF